MGNIPVFRRIKIEGIGLAVFVDTFYVNCAGSVADGSVDEMKAVPSALKPMPGFQEESLEDTRPSIMVLLIGTPVWKEKKSAFIPMAVCFPWDSISWFACASVRFP